MWISYVSILFRCMLAFIVLIAISRLIGQKYLTLVGVAAAVLVSAMSVRLLAFDQGLAALIVWSGLAFLTQFLTIQSPTLRNLVNGKPTVVIEQGKVLEKNLRKAKLSALDMMSLMRAKNVFKLSDVEFGILETDGQLSVLQKAAQQPLTPTLQGIPVENEQAPQVVLVDGQVMKQALQDAGYSEGWLLEQLRKQGAKDYNDVFLAQVDSKGNVYVDLRNDTLPSAKVQERPLLLASLKKMQADLESFALQTENPSAKQMYTENAERLQQLIDQMQPYLR
ncbi:DUF421 domain-containing protein [Alicyclobacillus cycloheptanicus]|uniref:Uncharacterized membrane protein YcaP (DUF421 family) n=1 Tax=Alicyclobacillus cycloheptanicus TaxID=1457 RepID=A0ABT9XMQ1_9BACL|nr:DUF421 domain-containing protein [Alicyclobacillus cycloheptanicus]MDQ0191405.1 uncharacterized membrane protein YcaP (DUF421 family) [Alicyclobacillus cycloheptanicus]WDM00330.1 DUF421 domain-containing protein [Alicyclobacillus cycloheptanicus]